MREPATTSPRDVTVRSFSWPVEASGCNSALRQSVRCLNAGIDNRIDHRSNAMLWRRDGALTPTHITPKRTGPAIHPSQNTIGSAPFLCRQLASNQTRVGTLSRRAFIIHGSDRKEDRCGDSWCRLVNSASGFRNCGDILRRSKSTAQAPRSRS